MHENLTKCPNFTWDLPEKINKMPEFYTIPPPCPPSPTPMNHGITGSGLHRRAFRGRREGEGR